jgi:type VI secretion system protein ImpC
MAQIAAAAHAPFIAGSDPKVMNMDSWQELSNPRDLTKIFQTPSTPRGARCATARTRSTSASRCPGSSAGSPTARRPTPSTSSPSRKTPRADHNKYTWSNSAYAMGVNINARSRPTAGAPIRGVESGGMVEGLPVHTFPTDDGGVDMKCPTEIAITDRREAELAKNGFMPLSHWKNTDYAVFVGAQSLHKPAEYEDPDATANANLGARLPYLFATTRFAHYLKCIVRDKVGSFKERADMEKWLNNWIMQYVEPDPANATEDAKARRPLAAAEVVVEEVEGNPGYYSSKFFLRPHYQLEGLSVSLRLVSKLPSQKG